jgi:hypothetical protein
LALCFGRATDVRRAEAAMANRTTIERCGHTSVGTERLVQAVRVGRHDYYKTQRRDHFSRREVSNGNSKCHDGRGPWPASRPSRPAPNFIAVNWIIILTAGLYLHGLFSIEVRQALLHTAELIRLSSPSYQDFLVRGYYVFLSLLIDPLLSALYFVGRNADKIQNISLFLMFLIMFLIMVRYMKTSNFIERARRIRDIKVLN